VFRFEEASGSRPAIEFHLAERSDRPKTVEALGAGEGCGFIEDDLDDRWEARSAGAPDQSLRPSGLPLRKYRLTGIYRGSAGTAHTTGPVEIEIVEPGKAGEDAPAPAAAK
jgi:hypothetical protein